MKGSGQTCGPFYGSTNPLASQAINVGSPDCFPTQIVSEPVANIHKPNISKSGTTPAWKNVVCTLSSPDSPGTEENGPTGTQANQLITPLAGQITNASSPDCCPTESVSETIGNILKPILKASFHIPAPPQQKWLMGAGAIIP